MHSLYTIYSPCKVTLVKLENEYLREQLTINGIAVQIPSDLQVLLK
jgi:hypothetical protein